MNFKKIAFTFLVIALLGIGGFAGWQLYGIWQQDHQIQEETKELEQ